MKKIIICSVLVVAVSLVGIVSIVADQPQVQKQKESPKAKPAPPPEKKGPVELVPRPRELKPMYHALPAAIRFGEPNNTPGGAHLLKPLAFIGRRYHAGFGNREDVDYYKFRAPLSGFGSWFWIEVRSVDPTPNFDLYITLLGPTGSNLEQITYESSGSLWIALKSGVEAKLKVAQGDSWPDIGYVCYDITLSFGSIPDNLEDDDTQTRATLLTYGGTKTAYMCGVLDSAGQTVGLADWFHYNHTECRNDCVEVSRRAYLALCKSSVPNDCEGCSEGENEGATRICVEDGCEGDGWARAGVRYINVRSFDWSYRCSGLGDVPIHYRSPYTIRLYDNGYASFDGDCVPGE